MKMIPLNKQSKKNRRAYHAARRGSWCGLSPVTRSVESRKTYDRARLRQADRRAETEG